MGRATWRALACCASGITFFSASVSSAENFPTPNEMRELEGDLNFYSAVENETESLISCRLFDDAAAQTIDKFTVAPECSKTVAIIDELKAADQSFRKACAAAQASFQTAATDGQGFHEELALAATNLAVTHDAAVGLFKKSESEDSIQGCGSARFRFVEYFVRITSDADKIYGMMAKKRHVPYKHISCSI
jgi:hypothetical protein